MPRTTLKFFIAAAVLYLPLLAAAGPGLQLSTSTILPQDVAKVVAARDAFMASSVGKQFKGRVVLLQHIADGADPASHTTVSIFHSAAELETFTKAAMNDPAYKAFLDAIVPISKLQMTTRTAALRSWGDIVDTDTVWSSFYFRVTDLAAVNVAMDEWQKSPMYKKFPGQGHLAAITFGGVGADAPTHVINVGWASIAEMESYTDMRATDPDWLKYQAALRKVSTQVGADLAMEVKSWGPATLKSLSP